MVPEHNRQYKKKLQFVSKEISSIKIIVSHCDDILSDMTTYCNKPSLKLDGVDYELGFDMYKFIYNITNIIADKCREIDDLSCKSVITELGDEYSISNNIGKIDMYCSPNTISITTTQGMVYATKVELAI
ncbi:hypothetical protein [Aliivibrio logei]|uniref:hypothetical protein n=1 Tax=Aliivibrio logei TaxID=688 RepID=UPI0003C7A77F|nr:hypothetical protein [Aliivibrio logei]